MSKRDKESVENARAASRAEYKALSFSADTELKKMIDERSADLGLSRSAYIIHVIRDDLIKRGPITIREGIDRRNNYRSNGDISRRESAKNTSAPPHK